MEVVDDIRVVLLDMKVVDFVLLVFLGFVEILQNRQQLRVARLGEYEVLDVKRILVAGDLVKFVDEVQLHLFGDPDFGLDQFRAALSVLLHEFQEGFLCDFSGFAVGQIQHSEGLDHPLLGSAVVENVVVMKVVA
jgi:hypothetical protein